MYSLLPMLAIIVVIAATAVTVWSGIRAAWGPVLLGILAAILGGSALWLILITPAVAQERKQEPVSGCAFSGFPICPPFQATWQTLESFYGPAISPAIQLDGRLTQCFKYGCLQHFPELPGYEVQAMLLGERFLKEQGQTPEPVQSLALPPIASRWTADKGKTADMFRILGEQLTGAASDSASGRIQVVWQRAIASWPEGSTDLADVRLEPLGDRYYGILTHDDPPWWSALWVRLGLVVGSLATSAFALIRGLLDPEFGGGFI